MILLKIIYNFASITYGVATTQKTAGGIEKPTSRNFYFFYFFKSFYLMNPFSYFTNAIQNHYADFNGRARRSEYWYFFLFNMIGSIVIGIIAGAIKFPILSSIYSVALLLPAIAVGVRRMHDVGKSGWFLIIPFYNFYLAVSEGTAGSNEYGADPKGGGTDITDHFVA